MNKSEQKLQRQLSLINLIRHKGKISQAELAATTGMRPSSISYIINEMKRKGLLINAGKGNSTKAGGKKANLLSLDPHYAYFGGIYIKDKEIVFNLMDFTGEIVSSHSSILACPVRESIIELISRQVRYWLKHFNYKATGIAVSYIVDLEGNVVLSLAYDSAIPHFIKDLTADFEEHIFIMENDANCSAFFCHETYQYRYSSLLNFLVYTEPFRLGCGIIIDGKLYKGFGGAAGEVYRLEQNEILKQVNPATEKDPLLIGQFLNSLKDYIISYATFLNCEALVLAGGVSGIDSHLLNRFLEEIRKELKHIVIKFSTVSDSAVRGASLLAIMNYQEKGFG